MFSFNYVRKHDTNNKPKQHRYNKLVLAQHLDDCVESLFMSLMHNGQVGTGALLGRLAVCLS